MATFTTSWIGQSLEGGRFLVDQKLGEGGMAIVFKAHDLVYNRDVVIKVPKQNALEDKTFLKRFAAENRALINLKHPHIVQILHVGEFDGWPFTVLEYLTGGDLEACRKEFQGNLSLLNVSKWMPSIAQALDFIHGQGYIHRDVKPANILFDGQGRAFLSDFGVAKVVSDQAAKMTRLTGTGMVLGTPDYMAPELIMGQPIDGGVDQYALGMTIYECLAGRLPIQAPTPHAILVMQATEATPRIEQFNPAISAAVSDTIMRALAKKSAERFPNCGVFAQAILAAIRPSVANAPPTAPHPMFQEIETAKVLRMETTRQPAQNPINARRPARKRTHPTNGSNQAVRPQPTPHLPKEREPTRGPIRRAHWPLLAGGVAACLLAYFIFRLAFPAQPMQDTTLAAQASPPPETKTVSPESEPTAPNPSPQPKPEKPALLVSPFDANAARERQQAWARYLSKADVVEANSIGMQMILIPPGEFLMGSPESELNRKDDEALHRVQITDAFYVAQTEVTQRQWERVMQTAPWRGVTYVNEGEDYPAANISWAEAIEFCEKLTDNERLARRLAEGWEYQLPTEAQWEYACRAGVTTAYSFGNDKSQLNSYGWYGAFIADGNAKNEEYPHVVGLKHPNLWKLYDMHGNLWEWCQDSYEREPQNRTDTLVESKGSAAFRVIRGGGWNGAPWDCRSANRSGHASGLRSTYLGLRVVAVQVSTSQTSARFELDPQATIGVDPVPPKTIPNSPPKPEKPDLLVAPFDANNARERQQAWAKYLGKSDVVETNIIGMKLVIIPPGEFLMGSPTSEANRDDDEAQQTVQITKPFSLGQTEVTQGQWEQVMQTKPWSGESFVKEGADFPATYVSWDDAQEFCRKLTQQEHQTGRLSEDWEYKLPTEAQWEYACRAGTIEAFSFGNDETKLGNYGWYGAFVGDGNAKGEEYAHLVGQKLPNPWGLFDMHGNVWEWCRDGYQSELPGGTDPEVASPATRRVVRGGGWYDPAWHCRSANRGRNPPDYRYDDLGFRVVAVQFVEPSK